MHVDVTKANFLKGMVTVGVISSDMDVDGWKK